MILKLLALLLVVPGLLASATMAGTAVTYEYTGDDTASAANLYEKAYGDKVEPINQLGEMDRFNAWSALHTALSEMLLDPTASGKSRDQYRTMGADNSYMYWNKQMSMMPRQMSDGSGRLAQTFLIPEDAGLNGKNVFMPGKETLDKAVDIMKAQKDLSEKLKSGEITQTQFDEQSGKLDEQFLQTAALEVSSIKNLSQGGNKVYGMGFIQTEDGQQLPLELNAGMIESSLRRLGITVPASTEAGTGTTQPASGPSTTSIANGPAVITVAQPAATVQEINQDYETFAEGFNSEAERTRAEIEKDMFRMRIRPQDVKPGQKIYDPYMTHELQSGGGLNLPSRVPQE